MKMIVIGAGAMGSIYGGRLSTGNDVTLVDTNEAVIDHVRENRIVLEENGTQNTYLPKIAKNADGTGIADLIILFTKAMY